MTAVWQHLSGEGNGNRRGSCFTSPVGDITTLFGCGVPPRQISRRIPDLFLTRLALRDFFPTRSPRIISEFRRYVFSLLRTEDKLTRHHVELHEHLSDLRIVSEDNATCLALRARRCRQRRGLFSHRSSHDF